MSVPLQKKIYVCFEECDIRDENQVAAAFKWIEEVCGGVDL